MKLLPLTKEHSKRKLTIILTTEQLDALARSVINEEEIGTIKKTYLIKTKTNAKKK